MKERGSAGSVIPMEELKRGGGLWKSLGGWTQPFLQRPLSTGGVSMRERAHVFSALGSMILTVPTNAKWKAMMRGSHDPSPDEKEKKAQYGTPGNRQPESKHYSTLRVEYGRNGSARAA